MKYKQWLTEWLENYVKPVSKHKTYLRYNEIIKQHITFARDCHRGKYLTLSLQIVFGGVFIEAAIVGRDCRKPVAGHALISVDLHHRRRSRSGNV